MNRFVLITGCSGGGKSSLLDELGRRGHAIVVEPGRRIVREELTSGGSALPWQDLAAFGRRAVAMALADRERHRSTTGWVFFDRGLPDAVGALPPGDAGAPDLTADENRYHPQVFIAPPWPEIFVRDSERRHHFDEAGAEYDRLCSQISALGYTLSELPKGTISERADFVLASRGDPPSSDIS